ncbi:class I SAM-dependent rRNA methyltransferase [Candidatus Peregrinibacteria bacterium]|nr:class I SAM-dependent rRNA methyltransferase [Candidatus Peregrinibacteria bacterium]
MKNSKASYTKILLRPGKDHILNFGHPWIFSQALAGATNDLQLTTYNKKIKNGEIADVYSSDGKRFLARGYYNGNSQIAVRILTHDSNEEIDEEFFAKRFRDFLAIRERFIDTKKTNAFRVVFGESDSLPGLIVDKYNRVFVIQIHTLGMDCLRSKVIAAMKRVFNPETIFEKSDLGVRIQEDLKDKPVQLLYGKNLPDEIEILENGVKFLVNIKDGQKTGFFLDQRENRKILQKYVAGKHVLNCFCYTAGFSVYAALAPHGGAKETINIDVSGPALETAKRNFKINGLKLQNHQFLDKDVFDALADFENKKEKFDIIILDPPAFVKNQKSLKQGLSGYLFINEHALNLLPQGGILVSSSCSAHVTDKMFTRMLSQAASRAHCVLKTLEIAHQPIDHPFNPHFPEGKYLKFYIMLKVE